MPVYRRLITFTILFVGFVIIPVAAQQNVLADGIDNTKVCMVDNVFKGEQQLTTTIEGKVFYGCCEPCIEVLNTDVSFRFATDPFSGSKVNKSEAYIVEKPNEKDVVLYFESKGNYQKYLQQHHSEN